MRKSYKGYILTPGRFIDAAEIEKDGEPFDQKMTDLVALLEQQLAEGEKLAKDIRQNLGKIDYGK